MVHVPPPPRPPPPRAAGQQLLLAPSQPSARIRPSSGQALLPSEGASGSPGASGAAQGLGHSRRHPDEASRFRNGNSRQDGPCDHSVTARWTGAESQMHPERRGASRELGRPRGKAASGTRGCQSPEADWPTRPFVSSSESLPLNPTSTPGTYQSRERNRALKEYVRKYWSVPEPPTGRAQADTGHAAVGP